MDGYFSELGPFRVSQYDHTTLERNPYSWCNFANIIFLDQPVGVGYSYSASGTAATIDDATAAALNLEFLHGFVEKFPEYQGRDFYIMGESYGGICKYTFEIILASCCMHAL